MRTAAARERVLNAIRENLAASVPFDAEHREHQKHKDRRLVSGPMAEHSASAVERFCENLTAVAGNCTVVASREEATRTAAAILEKIRAKRVAVSDSTLIGGLPTGAEVIENADAKTLFDCDAGITGAQWAIAETGTLVLESDRESNRLTSLVPPVHICVIEATRIRHTMGEILDLVRGDLSRTVTFITGPSRTSDIELTLAIGVHGPRELHVIIIDKN